jgi:hypothetical protein
MSRQEQKPDIWGILIIRSPQKDLKKIFNPQKKNNFFQTIIGNNSQVGLTQIFFNNAFMCDRKFRKLQKIAYSMAEMQIYNIKKGQKSCNTPNVGFLLLATHI